MTEEESRKHAAAIKFLVDHLHPDLTGDVISAANIIRKLELIEESPDDVDHSCCDSCSVWFHLDDNRCECGNRRMTWETSGDFEDMILYPMTY